MLQTNRNIAEFFSKEIEVVEFIKLMRRYNHEVLIFQLQNSCNGKEGMNPNNLADAIYYLDRFTECLDLKSVTNKTNNDEKINDITCSCHNNNELQEGRGALEGNNQPGALLWQE